MIHAAIPDGEVGRTLLHSASYIEDIHNQGGGWQISGCAIRPPLLRQAAARLTALEAENAALKAGLDALDEIAARIRSLSTSQGEQGR